MENLIQENIWNLLIFKIHTEILLSVAIRFLIQFLLMFVVVCITIVFFCIFQDLADNNEIYRLRISVRNTGNPDEDFVTTYTPAVSCYL